IGIDIDRFLSTNDKNHGLYRSLGLTNQATFFDKETWGVDKLLVRPASGGRGGASYTHDAVSQMPLSAEARKDLLRLYGGEHPDYMPGLSSAGKKNPLPEMSDQGFLPNPIKIDKQMHWFLRTYRPPRV